VPLVERDRQRLVGIGVVGKMYLEHQLPPATGVAIGGDHLAQVVVRLVDGGQPVGPVGAGARGDHRHRRCDQGGRLLGQAPEACPVDRDQPVVGDLLPGQQGPDDRHAFTEPGVADVLAGPSVAGDVLVHRLATAQRHPEPAGEHRPEGRGRLGDDRRVVALARGVHHPERQGRRRHRRAQPRPGEAGVPLRQVPGGEVVGTHGRGETGLLRVPDGGQQLGRVDLLVRVVEPEDGHGILPTQVLAPGRPQPNRAAAPAGSVSGPRGRAGRRNRPAPPR
jgi:hypothetical protein